MYEAAARNLRTAERFILAPPLTATFGASAVAICDISAKGARFRHENPLEAGMKSILKLPVESKPAGVLLEAVVVWTQADSATPGRFVSGVRTYGAPEVVNSFLAQLQQSHRTNRIEELRSTDRFHILPSIDARFGDRAVTIDNLSARGARIETQQELQRGASGTLSFHVPSAETSVSVIAQVAWSGLKAIKGANARTFHAGLFINEKPELMRLAIGQLCEMGYGSLDMMSLRLKLKIMRARARQLAPSFRNIEATGVPAEQYLLIQGVREELRLNPEEAMHWYRRARLLIADPATRAVAPPIANHPDALAVWEYLDRTVDPTIVGRAFELPA
ncbi:MAG TPA: PilZ domain-containing protein [Thermoanaerobaculia bacterium]|nr:PilZ domain-containing protein [Thermoanaerobaculia bacterium]